MLASVKYFLHDIQGLNDLDTAVSYYKEVVKYDATNVEAIACIATHYFYSEQPEMALRFYRYTHCTWLE